jgi:hypothetical protein
VDGNGNVGIGTTLPTAKLEVNGILQTNNPYYFARVRNYGGDVTGDIIFDRTPNTNVLSWLNTTTGHFKPLIPGNYFIHCALTTQSVAFLTLYKNGIETAKGLAQLTSAGWSQVVLSAIVSYNGTTDYTYFYVSGGNVGATNSGVGQLSIYKL